MNSKSTWCLSVTTTLGENVISVLVWRRRRYCGFVLPSRLLRTQPLVHTEVLSDVFQEMKGSRGYQREREVECTVRGCPMSVINDEPGETTYYSVRIVSSYLNDYETKKEGGSKFESVQFASSSTR